MCGIAGVLYHDDRPVDVPLLHRMGDAIAHRGPDAAGYWHGPHVGLVHRRLSIIDLGGGDQPIGNEDDSIQVVFNGEIYNFAELRRDLESRGHRFRTNSDTEVLVHLYEEHGERLVERLRGMFAFALWDTNRRRLVLARDRVGQKPLYVHADGEKVVFASELKAILEHPGLPFDVDPAAVADYLTYGFIPGERSIFRTIRKLPSAHLLVVEPGQRDLEPRCYWQLEFRPDESRTAADWLAIVDYKLHETVAAHRIADVPVGAFLSGGIDSSAMVATMSDGPGAPLRTFSIGFDEQRFDELPHARRVAKQFGTQHVERIVAPEAAAALDDVVFHYDEPFADSSAIPTMLVAKVAAEHVKVVVSGDGGDEAFGGYARYAHDLVEARLRGWLPRWFRRSVLRSVASIWPRTDWLPRPLRWGSALANLARDPAAAYASTMAQTTPSGLALLLSPELRATLERHRTGAIYEAAYGNRCGTVDPLTGMLRADTAVTLPDDFLVKVDRASMAYGLEVRPPMVDHEFLELAATIPSRFKIRGGETKWLLKELVRDRLPEGLVDRRKQGFEIPIDAWFRGPLAEPFRETVLAPNGRVAELIDVRTAQRAFESHLAGRARNGSLLWSLLVLGRWCDRWLPVPASSPARPDAAAVLV